MDTAARPIGYWLKLVDHLVDEQFDTILDEHGVTRVQWQLLNVLSREPATVEQLDAAVAPFLAEAGAAPDDAAAGGAVGSCVEHLTELIDSAWVDATVTGYELTERGRIAVNRLATVVAEKRAVMTQGLTVEQYDETVAVLERMARNLGYEG